MTEGEFVPYLPPPEKIVELFEKLDQGVVLGIPPSCSAGLWIRVSFQKISRAVDPITNPNPRI